MNRIPTQAWIKDGKNSLDNSAASKNTTGKNIVEQAVLRTGIQRGHQHCLFAPLHYERNYAYPLIVWLHGQHDDERQLVRIMPLISMRNYVAIAPRASIAHDDQRGFWWRDDESGVHTAEQRIAECIEIATRRFSVSSRRVFLAGLQSGGTMAFRIGLRNPQLFAGVASIGGPFPVGGSPLCGLPSIRQTPLLIAHGRDSQTYSIDRACDDLRLLHSAGMSVALRQYPCADDLTTCMLHDLNVWIMEQVTGQPASTEVGTTYDGQWN